MVRERLQGPLRMAPSEIGNSLPSPRLMLTNDRIDPRRRNNFFYKIEASSSIYRLQLARIPNQQYLTADLITGAAPILARNTVFICAQDGLEQDMRISRRQKGRFIDDEHASVFERPQARFQHLNPRG